MRILSVIELMNPLFGGATERAYQMGRYLDLAGWKVDILTTKWRLDREWLSQLPNGNIHSVDVFYFRYLLPLGVSRWLNKNIINYDIIHISKNWSLLASISAYVAIKNNTPYVFSPMGFVTVHNRSKLLKMLYRKYLTIPMIRNASACIAVTDEERNDLINAGASPESVHVIPNGIIPENFLHKDDNAFRDDFSLGNQKIMLFIGRMDPIKGVHLLIDAFHSEKESLNEWVLVLIGTQTSYRKKMEFKTLGLGLKDQVIFLDPIFGNAKSRAYHAAEFIVIPSVKDAMTIVAPEAACCSKPVLITNTSNFNELAECGGALEVNPTVESLSCGLVTMSSNDFNRKEMGKKGFDYIVQNYHWKHQVQKFMNVFSSVSKKIATLD